MNGSLPPSSSTLFLSARPARLATSRPARSLPVRVTALTRSSARIGGHLIDLDQERLEHAVGAAGVLEHRLDRQTALRHVRRVFEEHHVSRQQRRRCEPEHLPERKVPGHDGEHGAERLVADVAARGIGRDVDHFVGQERRAVRRVVPAAARGFQDLVAGGSHELAHLERHEPAETIRVRLEHRRRLVEHLRALGDVRASPRSKRGVGARQPLARWPARRAAGTTRSPLPSTDCGFRSPWNLRARRRRRRSGRGSRASARLVRGCVP